MIIRPKMAGQLLLTACGLALLAGCAAAPLGPTVQVMPGPGKDFSAFQSDNVACKAFAGDQVRGQAEASNQRAAGAALLGTVLGAGLGAAVGGAAGDAGGGAGIGAATGLAGGTAVGAGNGATDQAMIQQQYDNAFSQCMYAHGEQVPGFAPAEASAAVPYSTSSAATPDPVVRATQSELIRLGYMHGRADGFMGPRTRNAIASYESAHGIPADGSPSRQLLAQMQSTPGGGAAQATTASAPTNWVAPTSGTTTDAAPSPAGWVAPTK